MFVTEWRPWAVFGLVGLIVLLNYKDYITFNVEIERRLTSPAVKKPSVAEMIVVGTDPTLALMLKKKSSTHTRRPRAHNSTALNQTDAQLLTTNNTTVVKENAVSIKSSQHTTSNESIAVISAANEHSGPLFYMYDLGEEFWWRWPVDGSDCSGNGYVGHEHKENSGIGPLVDADSGLYLTWHFSLFSSLYNRMKRSSRRTLDPEKASLFIIPYDLGLDGYLDAKTCNNRRQCSNGLVGKLTTLLKKSKYFQRHDGADHALLWSLGQYHPWPRAGCDILMKDFCAKCTITCYWMDATKADSRFISIPFPSGYHWWDGIKKLPWDTQFSSQRNLTAVYLGSTQTLNPTHTKIRRAMTAQCNTSSECHWLQISHSSKDTNIVDLLSVYKKATFCLCPPGDDPARKAVFDCIVSGSIPVIFELNTIFNQYHWHFTEQEALDFSVYIPGGMVRSGKVDFMSVLLAISPEVIRKKQEVLATIAPRVQYAMPPPERLADRYDNSTWDPPFKDGVELTLDGMFARANNVINNRSTHIPPKLQSGREWGREYDMVRVQVPNITTGRAATQALQDQLIRQGMKASAGQPHHVAAAGGHGNGRGGHGNAQGNGHGNGHNANNHGPNHQGNKNHGNAHNNGHGHDNGHNRKHKQPLAKGEDVFAPKESSSSAEGGPGKPAGRVGSQGNKNLRSVPAMAAPGEEENVGLAE